MQQRHQFDSPYFTPSLRLRICCIPPFPVVNLYINVGILSTSGITYGHSRPKVLSGERKYRTSSDDARYCFRTKELRLSLECTVPFTEDAEVPLVIRDLVVALANCSVVQVIDYLRSKIHDYPCEVTCRLTEQELYGPDDDVVVRLLRQVEVIIESLHSGEVEL